MPDPLLSVREARFRGPLAQIREWEGDVVEASRIQALIPGFRAFKGIYKPAGSDRALWVRQTNRGVYPDQEPSFQTDGSWTYRYSPESQAGQVDESLVTFKGLLQCMKDGTPIGVFRQADDVDGKTAYRVMGLGIVTGFEDNHFVIRGEPIIESEAPVPEESVAPFSAFEFSPAPIEEVRRKLRERRFGAIIRELYHDRCSLCSLGYRWQGRSLALEAAHVVPVQAGGVIGDVRNGILLCSNHHALFDAFAWTFDRNYQVEVSNDRGFRESASLNHLLEWDGKRLPNLPSLVKNYPGAEAIDWRLSKFRDAQ